VPVKAVIDYVETRDDAGRLQGITVHRLKDKMGTRKVPTAELTLDGLVAVPVAGLTDGVRNISPMLNITRTWNAVSAVSFMRRAMALSRDYARRRVAFGATGTNDRVMTSPDGITWTTRTSAADNLWWGVTYGDGLFVAVAVGATTGTGNRVMTSGVLNTTSGSSGSSVPVFSLSFDSMPGVLVSGTGGSWVSLPTPTNPPAMSPNSTFLGWATYEEFPVAIAQRQIDNGWGAYEVFRDDGSIRGVFIPVEGSACITASGIMYPIWSDSSA